MDLKLGLQQLGDSFFSQMCDKPEPPKRDNAELLLMTAALVESHQIKVQKQ